MLCSGSVGLLHSLTVFEMLSHLLISAIHFVFAVVAVSSELRLDVSEWGVLVSPDPPAAAWSVAVMFDRE